jgi:hypothetical protein
VEEVPLQSIASLKFKILSILVPQDAEKMKLLRHEMSLDPKNNKLKGEFENLLMRSSTAGLMQVKEYHPEERKLEVRTISVDEFPSKYLLVS